MSDEHSCNDAWEDCPGCRVAFAELAALRKKYAGVPLPEKTMFFESPFTISEGLYRRITEHVKRLCPGWNLMILEDGVKISPIHGNPETVRKSLGIDELKEGARSDSRATN